MSLLASLIFLLNSLHPYHVAVCEIQNGPNKKGLQITHKIFTDDLESGIEKTMGIRLLLGYPKQNPKAQELIGQYVSKHFILNDNNKPLQPKYLGFEIENDQCFVYFEEPDYRKPKALSISYPLLMERFEDQNNIVHLDLWGLKKSIYFRKSDNIERLKFND